MYLGANFTHHSRYMREEEINNIYLINLKSNKTDNNIFSCLWMQIKAKTSGGESVDFVLHLVSLQFSQL